MNKLRPWIWLLAASLVLSLTACNTVQGVGKDLKKAGQKIEDTAKK